MHGGDQEKGIRPGTLPTSLIVGLGKAIEIADQNRIIELQEKLIETIEKINKTIKYDLFAEEHLKAKQHNCSMEGYN
jgi:cysteine desulfurase